MAKKQRYVIYTVFGFQIRPGRLTWNLMAWTFGRPIFLYKPIHTSDFQVPMLVSSRAYMDTWCILVLSRFLTSFAPENTATRRIPLGESQALAPMRRTPV